MWVLSHDGFARQETVRMNEREWYDRGGSSQCDWCGAPRDYQHLYRYGTRPDDSNRTNWHKGHFCSKSCHDSYHC
jgi:hypothetical protein